MKYITLFFKFFVLYSIFKISNYKSKELELNSNKSNQQFFTRRLQTNPPNMYNQLIGFPTNIEFSGNTILYDSNTKNIFAVIPDNTNPANMQLVAIPYNSPNISNLIKVSVGAYSCSFIQFGAALNYLPYNIAYIEAPNQTWNQKLAIFHNQNTATFPFPKTDCVNEMANLSIYTFSPSNNSFTLIKKWSGIFNSNIISGINTATSNSCAGCNIFQPRSSVWVKSSQKLVGLFVYSKADLTSKLFILTICTADYSVTNPITKVLIFTDSFSNYLMNVREIYNVPNTPIVYFILQENNVSFMATVNIDQYINYQKNPGSKIPIGDQMFATENQPAIYYDPISTFFIQMYVSKINTGKSEFTIFLFKLDINYSTIVQSLFRRVAYAYSLPLNSQVNAVRYMQIYSNFLYFCDYYFCFSAKFDFNTISAIPFTFIPINSSANSKISKVIMTTDFSDVLIWLVGKINVGGQDIFFLGNTASANLCHFYTKTDNSKCQAICDVGWAPFDAKKICYNNNCPSTTKYLYNFVCSASCNGMNAVEDLFDSRLCRNTPCPITKYFLDKKYSNGVYHECLTNCPNNLYQALPEMQCLDYCNSNLYDKVLQNNQWVNICLLSCNSGLADLRKGNSGPPFLCYNGPSCPPATLVVKPFEYTLLMPVAVCVSECPLGYVKDLFGKFCTKCNKLADGFLWNGVCVGRCPIYTVNPVNTNLCINCKDENLIWFMGNCQSTVPIASVLVDEFFNAYKSCIELKMLIYLDKCVDNCPLYSYPYELDKNYCYDYINGKKFTYNNTSVDACPIGYGSDDTGSCYSCYGTSMSLYEYKRKCVNSCPLKYFYDDNHVCIDCKTGGKTSDAIYRSRCLIPECPSNALIDAANMNCIYCKDSGTFKYLDSCESLCPLNSQIDFDRYECIPCGDKYYYKNKCWNRCPEGTSPTNLLTCIDSTPSCNPNPCLNNGQCTFYNNKTNCMCTNNIIFTGQYCQITNNYLNTFSAGNTENMKVLYSNYTLYNNYNNIIRSLNEAETSKIISNLQFLHENSKNFDSEFVNGFNYLFDILSQYQQVLLKSKYYPTYSLFNLLNFMLELTKNLISNLNNMKRQLSITLLSNQSLSETAFKIKNQILNFSEIIIKKNFTNNSNNWSYNNFSFFNLAFYSSSSESDVINFFKKVNHTNVEYSKCLNSLFTKLQSKSFVTYTIEWIYDFSSSNDIEVKKFGQFDFGVYDQISMNKIDISTECGSANTKQPIYIQYSIDYGVLLNRTLNDYYNKKNIIIYNSNPDSNFYNDRCFVYQSDDLFDITLNYRRKVLYPGITVSCGNQCTFIGIDVNNFLVCSCLDHSTLAIFIKKTVIQELFLNNLDLIYCASYVFHDDHTLNNVVIKLKSNIGFWISCGFLIIIILIFSINFIFEHFNKISNRSYLKLMKKIQYYDASMHTKFISPFYISDLNNISRIDKKYSKIEDKLDKEAAENLTFNNYNERKGENYNENEIKNKMDLDINEIEVEIENTDIKDNENITDNEDINDAISLENQPENENEKIIESSPNDIHSLYITKMADRKRFPVDLSKYIKSNKDNEVELTYQDILNLNVNDILSHDKRKFWEFYKDWIINYNYFIFALFSPSVIYPFQFRILIFITNIALEFTLNSMLFYDIYIDNMFELKTKYGFYFVFTNHFEKVIISILISQVPIIILRYFILVPSVVTRRKFNQYLISNNYIYMKEGQKLYIKDMRCRHYTTMGVCGILLGWCLFYNTVFCGIYSNTQIMWLYGGLISFSINSVFIQGLVLPLIYYLIRELSRKNLKIFICLYNCIRN